MRVLKIALVLSALVGTAACGGEQPRPEMDRADLSWLDTMDLRTPPAQAVASPLELGMVHAPRPDADSVAAEEKEEEKPVAKESRKSSTTKKATSTRRRSSGYASSGSRSGSSSGSYEAPAPRARVVTVRNTKRDAAIGAVTGAAVGAVAGGKRNRVKGALIGAAVGGAAGAIVGHTVDKQRKVVYDY